MKAGSASEIIQFLKDDLPLKAYTSIHDPISVRVLIVDSAVLVNMDLTSLPDEAIHRFQNLVNKETGRKDIFIAVSHTFSSPHIPPHIHNDQEKTLSHIMYMRIEEALRQACKKAISEIHEVSVSYGESECFLNVNRNIETSEGWWLGENPSLYSNHVLQVLSFGNASVVTYDMQSSLLDKTRGKDGGLLISSDIFGKASADLKEEGKNILFLPGCAGDQSPVRKEDNCFTQVEEDGHILAEAVRRAMKNARRVPTQNLRLTSKKCILPGQKMKIPTKELTPHHIFDFEPDPKSVEIENTLLKVGDISLLFTMPELNSSFGNRVRKITGKDTMIATLVNGGRKYLPEKTDYQRITYNAMNTAIGEGSDSLFLENVKELKEAEQ